MTLEVPELMAKARRSLAAARRDRAEEDYDFAVSRAYYAMFYAAEALLLHRGLSFSRHSGVIAGLQREYVASGELSRGHYEALQRGFEDRSEADYVVPVGTLATAEETIRAADAFMSAAERLLGS